MSGKSPYPTQGSYMGGHPPPQHGGAPPAYGSPTTHAGPGIPGGPAPGGMPGTAPPTAPGMPPPAAQYYPQQYPTYAYPTSGYPGAGYPQQYSMTPPGSTVHVQGGFAAGARFDAGSTAHVPPPPPGAMPNAAQSAMTGGHNVVVTQRASDMWNGSGGDAQINTGW